MLSDKSVLLEQINSTILKNSCEKCSELGSDSMAHYDELINSDSLSSGNHFAYLRSLESIKKLEQRIKAVEDQNDQLLFFIHYLYKNFPDLVGDILAGKNDHMESELQCKQKNQEPGNFAVIDPSLTRREKEILALLIKGLCAKEIAGSLFISETTVITHKKNMIKKFNAKNTVELISKAFMILFKSSK